MNDKQNNLSTGLVDWLKIARLSLTSRFLDELEESQLYPKKKVLYQFSARGHEVSQVTLGSLLNHPHDGVGAYYRSRPLLLSLGVSLEDVIAGPLATSGGYSDGRDIGVVCNLPGGKNSPTVLPMAGDVGSQYTPSTGWAQAIEYRRKVLNESQYDKAIAVVLGGEGSVATNGFWSSLTMATTLDLPILFYIEDNGYAISVTSDKQTPGANIAANLASFQNLKIWQVPGANVVQSAEFLEEAISFVREQRKPGLIRVTVPRLCGHSGQDNQAYKGEEKKAQEESLDPLLKLKAHLVPEKISAEKWEQLETLVRQSVDQALEKALARSAPDPSLIHKYAFAQPDEVQKKGGLAAERHVFPPSNETPKPEGARINLLTAVRKTLQVELETNSKLLVFGEDVGAKGGVHAATLGLQDKFGAERVFDTSLSEEGIIGRAVGMAIAGLMPVAEIQFRKYADPAMEQLNNCGTIRWRTANRFAAPIVVRLPGGYAKCGDPWHSVCGEVVWAHAIGWQVILPSNAEDAVGLLRAAMRSNNPTIFFEHRALLDAPGARRPYPGDEYILPLGKAHYVQKGDQLTVVTWGAMVERCQEAAQEKNLDVDIIDLRTLVPWDKETVLESLRKSKRCLIVHEDNLTAGFGAEISAILVKEAFFDLDAPIERIAPLDVPIPHNVNLMDAVVPRVGDIAQKMVDLIEF